MNDRMGATPSIQNDGLFGKGDGCSRCRHRITNQHSHQAGSKQQTGPIHDIKPHHGPTNQPTGPSPDGHAKVKPADMAM
jgi:hypothetical protein